MEGEQGLTNQGYSELFEQLCPYYMSIGMTYEQFWYDDVRLAEYYRKADDLRLKRKNQELWLQGMYVYEALCDASPLFRFSMKGGQIKPQPYTQEPYPITEEEAREREERKARAEQERLKAEFEAFVAGMRQRMQPPAEAQHGTEGGELSARND